jgi:hypothetical protein
MGVGTGGKARHDLEPRRGVRRRCGAPRRARARARARPSAARGAPRDARAARRQRGPASGPERRAARVLFGRSGARVLFGRSGARGARGARARAPREELDGGGERRTRGVRWSRGGLVRDLAGRRRGVSARRLARRGSRARGGGGAGDDRDGARRGRGEDGGAVGRPERGREERVRDPERGRGRRRGLRGRRERSEGPGAVSRVGESRGGPGRRARDRLWRAAGRRAAGGTVMQIGESAWRPCAAAAAMSLVGVSRVMMLRVGVSRVMMLRVGVSRPKRLAREPARERAPPPRAESGAPRRASASGSTRGCSEAGPTSTRGCSGAGPTKSSSCLATGCEAQVQRAREGSAGSRRVRAREVMSLERDLQKRPVAGRGGLRGVRVRRARCERAGGGWARGVVFEREGCAALSACRGAGPIQSTAVWHRFSRPRCHTGSANRGAAGARGRGGRKRPRPSKTNEEESSMCGAGASGGESPEPHAGLCSAASDRPASASP